MTVIGRHQLRLFSAGDTRAYHSEPTPTFAADQHHVTGFLTPLGPGLLTPDMAGVKIYQLREARLQGL